MDSTRDSVIATAAAGQPPGLAGPGGRQLARARFASRVQFAGLGLMSGAWGAHIPSVKARFAVGEAALSLVLLAAALGAISAMFFAGRVVARLGSRTAIVAGCTTMGCLLSLVLVMPSYALVLPVMVVCGAASSVFDVSMNAEGSALEQLGGRAVMSGLHAMFSVGAMSGAALAGTLLRVGVPATLQLPLLCGSTVLAVALASRTMLQHPPEPAGGAGHAHFAWPRGLLLTLGLMIFAGMVSEGVMYDWSVLFLEQERGLSHPVAAFGYSAFTGAMALARFAGDALRDRFPERRLLAGSALLAALAMLLVLASTRPASAFAGFALVGVGLALIVPILFNAAAHVPGTSRAAGIAAVSSIGYAGFLVGPPLIGGIAQALSLSAALSVVVVATGLLAWAAHRLACQAAASTPT